MTIPDYRAKGVTADMPFAPFVDVLHAAGSPVTPEEAWQVYAYCLKRGLSPAFLLAMFHHESGYGRFGSAVGTHSWGNTRPPSYGVADVGITDRFFSVYNTWVEGGVSTVARLFDHTPYLTKQTVRQIIPIWAPASENDVERYIEAVLADIEFWTQGAKVVTVPRPPIDASHPSPNKWVGGRKVEAIVDHITDGTNSLGWLTSPASNASSNYLIRRDGWIYQLVPPTESAWTNGQWNQPDLSNPLVAQWRKDKVNPNLRTLTIEHECTRAQRLTAAQRSASIWLQAWLCQEFNVPADPTHIFGHNLIDSVNRKYCPGFTGEEWALILTGIRDRLGATGGEVKEPPEGEAQAYINDKGQTIYVWNAGGVAVKIDGANAVDLGVSVENAAGQKWDRSIQGNVAKPWVPRP